MHLSACWYASPVLGSHFGRLCCALHGSGRVCLITGDTSGLKGPSLQVLTLFGGIGFITWHLRRPSLGKCRRGPRHFWKCWTRVRYGPVPGPTLKRPCAILVQLVGRKTNTVLCEMQTASSRIWTCVAVFIFYDDNHYTTGTPHRIVVTEIGPGKILVAMSTHKHTKVDWKVHRLTKKLSCIVPNPAARVFANGPGDLGSIPGRVIPKTLKMVLDTTLLNTQHYKVRFKGKVEQSWEWSSALPYTLV